MSKRDRQRRWKERSAQDVNCLTVEAPRDPLTALLMQRRFLRPLDAGDRNAIQAAAQELFWALLRYEQA